MSSSVQVLLPVTKIFISFFHALLNASGMDSPYDLARAMAMAIHWDKDLKLSSVQIDALTKYIFEDTHRFAELMIMDHMDIIKIVSHLVIYGTSSVHHT